MRLAAALMVCLASCSQSEDPANNPTNNHTTNSATNGGTNNTNNPTNNASNNPTNNANNEPGCGVEASSDLPGVSIDFGEDSWPCELTLAQAAEGVSLPYRVVVTQTHTVRPDSYQNGCDAPGPSGLRPFARIFGANQNYCLCDVGLCFDDMPEVDVTPGTHAFALEWAGKNWEGPSDTNNMPGAAFPTGSYTIEVKATGTSNDVPYTVSARGTLRITP